MKQNTPEWRAAKQRKIGGTAARVIMGVDPWQTPYQLWEQLTGRAEPPPINPAMRRGMEREGAARTAFEEHSGHIVQPAFASNPKYPWAIASLDGRTFDGEGLVEIKAPGKDAHEETLRSGVPEHYFVQVQHYLAVTEALWCDYVSYCPEHETPLTVLRVRADSAYHAILMAKEAEWYERHLVRDEPPAKGDRDVIIRTDATWLEAARLYREAEAGSVEWGEKLNAARELLLSLRDGAAKVAGGGVSVTTFDVKGSLNWSALVKAATQQGIDVEAFRQPGRTQTRVSIEKEKS